MTNKCLLIDVDSTIPNLALMHISTWKKSLGYEVGFNVSDPTEIYASTVFTKNRHKTDGLEYLYPNSTVNRGGSGINLIDKLPDFVDKLMPDYSLYPDCDYDLGFTSRGCNRNCTFCFVPKKEGKFHRFQHPSEFHNPEHKKIVLLDNNILFDKEWFFEVTNWIIENKMSVDFNQGLDIRLMDSEIASQLKRLKHFKPWHFAFDSMNYHQYVLDGVDMLESAHINLRSSTVWYVFINDDSQFEDGLQRCNILREHNCLAYPMLNPENEHTRRLKDLKRWCRPWFFFKFPFEQYNHKLG